MNFALQMLMNRLQSKNPQAFQMVNQAINNGGNPNAVLNQMLRNASPEQKQSLIQQARNYGCPDSVLKQIQNMK